MEPAADVGLAVVAFIHTLVPRLEPVLRENEPLPPEALPFLHPSEANRRYDSSRPPKNSLRRRLIRLTWP